VSAGSPGQPRLRDADDEDDGQSTSSSERTPPRSADRTLRVDRWQRTSTVAPAGSGLRRERPATSRSRLPSPPPVPAFTPSRRSRFPFAGHGAAPVLLILLVVVLLAGAAAAWLLLAR
jgi:hypothetical protein